MEPKEYLLKIEEEKQEEEKQRKIQENENKYNELLTKTTDQQQKID
jgi:hypothetical protein